jgi:hypothetical protein
VNSVQQKLKNMQRNTWPSSKQTGLLTSKCTSDRTVPSSPKTIYILLFTIQQDEWPNAIKLLHSPVPIEPQLGSGPSITIDFYNKQTQALKITMYFVLAIWVLLILYELFIAFNRLYFYDTQKEVKRRQDDTAKAIELEILTHREQEKRVEAKKRCLVAVAEMS